MEETANFREKRWLALALLCSAQFVVVLDASIVNVALPSIGEALGFSQANLPWVVNAYVLTFGGFLLLGGRTADLLGRRRVFMGGLLMVALASLAAGFAASEGQLIAARAAQGLGAATISPAALSIVTTTFDDGSERNRALGVWGAVAGSGGAAGVLLGGVLTDGLGWEWVLWVNVPVSLAALAVSPRLIAESRADTQTRAFDAAGAVTITAALSVLVYALVDANDAGWGSGQTLGLIAGSAALAVVAAWGVARARRIDGATAFVTVVLAALAASGVRHQGLFFIGSAFFTGESLADGARRPKAVPAVSKASWDSIAIAACALAAAWCIWTPPAGLLRSRQGPHAFGLGVESGRFPVAAVDALEARPDTGPLYNDVAFGGYLAWRLYPRRVFIDGRNEVNPDLLREVVRARSDSRAWSALLERYGIERALVRYDDRLVEVTDPTGKVVSRHTPNALLFPRGAFALVHWDDVAMVLVRRTPENAERLSRDEYRFVHPEDSQATLHAAASDPTHLAGAMAEVERRLRGDPACARALALRDELARIGRGRPSRAGVDAARTGDS